MTYRVQKKSLTILMLSLIILSISSFSCIPPETTSSTKIDPLLSIQINLRKQQLSSPTQERLNQMQEMGMNTSNMGVQRIYIHLYQPLAGEQQSEIQALGVQIYLNSWVTPAGNHPTGFYLADMPVDKLYILAAKDYVVMLDTAERQLHPLIDLPKGA